MTRPRFTSGDGRNRSGPNTWSRRAVLGGLAAAGATAATPTSGAAARARQQTDQSAGGPLADPDAFESFLDGVMETALDVHDVAGATVSVVDGEETFAKGYGYGDVSAQEPVDAEETLFRVGSVSKLFAWTVVMQGIERGELDPSVDVNRYLEGFEIPDTFDEPVTLEHLATHTAGFEDRARGTFVPDAEDLEPLETVLREEQPARVRPPGQFAAYSNYGTGVAAHVAAEAAGASFDTLVAESVLDPLGMDRSTFAQPPPDDLRADLSRGYVPDGDSFREGDFEYVGMPPVGSMSATATDMARFMRAHLQNGATDDGRILDPESVEAMHRQRFTHDERLNGMCFGFYEMSRNGAPPSEARRSSGDEPRGSPGVRAVGHAGDTELFHSLLVLLPERDVGLFVSFNSPGGVPARQDLVDAFFDQYYPTDEESPRAPGEPPARESALTGSFRAIRMPYTTSEKFVGAPGTISVSVDDQGRLVTAPPGGQTRRWVQTDSLYFEEVGGEDALAFREDDGEITHLFFDSRPPTAYDRVPFHEQTLVHLVVLGLSLLAFLSALVGWPAAAAWRRYRGRRRPATDSLARYGRWAAGTAAGAFTALVVAFLVILATDPIGFLVGDPLPFRLLLLLPAAGAIATAASVGFAVVAWRDAYWRRWSRIHYSLVTLAAVAVTLVLAYWNLLWYQM